MGASSNTMRISQSRREQGSRNGKNFDVCVPFWGIVGDACCIAYKLQPHCTDNRHIHAYIQKLQRVAFICVTDITHKKSIRTLLFEDEEINLIPSGSLNNTELQQCNVIGLHKDLVTVQVFCQESIKIVVCSFIDNSCKLIFDRKYHAQNKLQLLESYISRDENVMILKQNQIYSLTYATGSAIEPVTLVKINWDRHSCVELSSETLDKQLSVSAKVSVVFDPRTDNDLVVFISETDDRGVMTLYKPLKDKFLFKIIMFKSDSPALPGKFQNLQFMPDGSAIVLTVLGSGGQSHCVPAICRNQTATVFWLHPDCFDKVGSFWYISPSSYLQYMPLISNSGRFACCGGKVYSLHDMHPYLQGTMSLKRMCRDIILDCVLAEDLNKLPLPKPILKTLISCDPDINYNV